jgi:hypothetical protein
MPRSPQAPTGIGGRASRPLPDCQLRREGSYSQRVCGRKWLPSQARNSRVEPRRGGRADGTTKSTTTVRRSCSTSVDDALGSLRSRLRKAPQAASPCARGSLERHGHLKLDETIRTKLMAASAATVDRLLGAARAATRAGSKRGSRSLSVSRTSTPATSAMLCCARYSVASRTGALQQLDDSSSESRRLSLTTSRKANGVLCAV